MSSRFTRSFITVVAAGSLLLTSASSVLAARNLRAGSELARQAGRRHQPRRHAAGRHAQQRRAAAVLNDASADPSPAVLLGEDQLTPNVRSLNPGEAEAFLFTAQGSGSVSAMHVFLGARSSAAKLLVGLYASLGDRPGTLLGSGILRSPRGGQWDTVAVASEPLLAGGAYWLAVLGSGGTLKIRHGREAACSASALGGRGLPRSWATSTTGGTCPISAYATGVPAAPVLGGNPVEESSPVAEPPPSEHPAEEPQPVAEPPPVEPPPVEPPPVEPPPAAPLSTSPPRISGSAIEGQTLASSTGSWSGAPTSFSYEWERCTPAPLCSTIAGAKASSYVAGPLDLGSTLRVRVIAANAGGSTSATSAQTALVTAPPAFAPVNTVAPAISGSAIEGQTLKATNGSWSGSPGSFAYEWQRCSSLGGECGVISAATGSSYSLGAADVGHTIRVLVTATNAGGSTHAASTPTGVVTAKGGGGTAGALFISPSGKDSNACSEAQPCLTMGHAYEKASAGQTVQMLSGSYPAQTISGTEKGAAHVVFAPAAGASVIVSGTIYVFASHLSIEGITVQDVTVGNYDQTPGRPNPSDVSLLDLTGRNFQIDSAKQVTVEGGSWGPASACGGPYGGGNNSIREPIPGVAPENIVINNTVIHDVQSYNLTECHIEGLAIFAGNHVTVSGSKFYGNSVYDIFIQANSGGSPNNITIARNWMAEPVDDSGANGHEVGYHNGIVFGSEISSNLTLTGNHLNGIVNIDDDGSISTYTNTVMQYNFGKMAYSGYPCASLLKGVVWTENVWQNDKCGASDVNLEGAAMPYANASNESTLDYTLTGMFAGWPSEAGAGASAPVATSPPTISGTSSVGQVLSAATGTWSGAPTAYAYQWQDCNASGAGCAAIAGATAARYTLAASDVEHTVRVLVTATGAGGSGQATSAQTAVVAGSGSGSSGVLFVSASGSDAGSCSEAAPCRSLSRAYTVAKAGESVRVAAGSYTDSSLPLVAGKGSGAPVVFEPAPGAAVRFSKMVNVEAHDVELKGFTFERELFFGETAESVVARDNALHNFEIIANGTKAPKGISIIGGTAGPVADSSDNENNLIATNGPETTAVPSKITVEGVLIHEYTKVGAAHVDCLQIWAGNELLIRGNTFKRCAVFDVFLQSLPNGSAGTPKNVTIENNVLEKTIEGFFSIFLPRHNEGNPEHFENVLIENNSATQSITADPRASYSNVKLLGNIAPQVAFWNESSELDEAAPAGVEADYNVLYGAGAKKSGAHDQLAPSGFASEATLNLHLTALAAAIKHGDPSEFPSTDIEGNPRPNPPDAGAYQYTGS